MCYIHLATIAHAIEWVEVNILRNSQAIFPASDFFFRVRLTANSKGLRFFFCDFPIAFMVNDFDIFSFIACIAFPNTK